jgi:hypothetical protein
MSSFFQAARRDDLFAAGERGFVAAEIFRHLGDGLFAELKRLLHDRAVNVAAGHTVKRLGIFVEANDFHLARLAAPRTALRIAGPL